VSSDHRNRGNQDEKGLARKSDVYAMVGLALVGRSEIIRSGVFIVRLGFGVSGSV